MSDIIQRFTFANLPVRGEIISLETSYQQICDQHHYSDQVSKLLGEALAASALMAEIIKIEGKVTLQLQSPSYVKLLLAECDHHGHVRGVLHTNGEQDKDYHFQQWTEQGQMAITIQPNKGQRYQGVVSLTEDTLADCIQDYFIMSEQLATYIKLFVSPQKVTGLFLQAMPSSEFSDYHLESNNPEHAFEHVKTLAETLKEEEALNLSHEAILFRLYHQDDIRLLASKPLTFQCSCSRQRYESALLTIQASELMTILQEQQGQIEMVCDFCSKKEVFDQQQVTELLISNQGNSTIN